MSWRPCTALQFPRNRSSSCQKFTSGAGDQQRDVQNVQSLSLPSYNVSVLTRLCVCVRISNPQCQPRNCMQGLNKGSEVKMASRSSGRRLCSACLACAHVSLSVFANHSRLQKDQSPDFCNCVFLGASLGKQPMCMLFDSCTIKVFHWN